MNEITFDNLKEAIHNSNSFIDDVDELEAILRQYITISKNSKALEMVQQHIVPIKLGNSKIGDDTMILNLNHGLNCYSSKMGYCENCNTCYAKEYQSTYKNSCLFGLASEINFNNLGITEIIKGIENKFKKEFKKNKIKFLRFNESGDFTSFESFKKANQIAKHFFQNYGIISYSYTHNKELLKHIDYIDNSYIVVNWSIKTPKNSKRCITAYEYNKKYLDNSKYVICNGECKNCSYCKDKDDKRIIVFMARGKGLKGLNMLPEGLIDVLNENKLFDWCKFYSKIVNPSRLTLDDFL